MGNEYHSFSPKLKRNLMVRLTKAKKIHICLLPHLLQILGEQTKTLWFLQHRWILHKSCKTSRYSFIALHHK